MTGPVDRRRPVRDPAYLALERTGELARRAEAAREILRECRLCPRTCAVDRLAGARGFCEIGSLPTVSSVAPHFGEERPLVGHSGSGTVFLTGCNLGCVFCQNYDISHLRRGGEISPDDLAGMMLSLQRERCHNINFVTPTHQVPQILEALCIAIPRGLTIPLVYNCGGYESYETIRLLDGVVDIYMPDLKYADNEVARELSQVSDYVERSREAVREMHRQVGDLDIDGRGIACRGLLIRHLVLPGGLAGTADVMRFIADELSAETYVNVMDQYHPCYEAKKYPPMDRRITGNEFLEALDAARRAGLSRLDGFI